MAEPRRLHQKARDTSQVKDDNLKTLNVGSDLYPPFVYTDEYGDIVAWMSRY